MYKLLGSLSSYLKVQEVITDNTVFRLHNVFTAVLLLCCSLIITGTQYVGQPISCIVNGLPNNVVNTFCWIMSTFTMPEAFNRQVGIDVAQPGIDNDFNDDNAKKYYTYYQWVCFVLFFQACACYTPKFLWNMFEGNLMRTLSMGLHLGICDADEKTAKTAIILKYLKTHRNRHTMYAIRYWLCEFLCLVNIVVQMWLMNSFFDGEFMSYGLRVLNLIDTPQDERIDPMVFVFPRMTKCNFYKFGPSGTIQKHDSLCLLPLNIVNEKTYIFIWFWYIMLLVLLFMLLIYRACIILMPKLRRSILNARNRMVPSAVAHAVSDSLDLGDWWVIYMLGRNLDPIVYRAVLTEMSDSIEIKKKRKH